MHKGEEEKHLHCKDSVACLAPASEEKACEDQAVKQLIEKAFQARMRAYVPYSRFHVGAALETESGEIFLGCNVENASYGATNCAERTAVFKAVSEGHRRFRRIAIVGGFMEDKSFYAASDFALRNGNEEGKREVEELCYPCGICRQVMAEFSDLENFQVILAKTVDEYRIHTLKELLPHAFLPVALD